jgi:CDP-diglyceride synthetase
MTDRTGPAPASKSMVMAILAAALIFYGAATYVRFTSDPDPTWSKLGTPLLAFAIGLTTWIRPSEALRPHRRTIAFFFFVIGAILLALILGNSGAELRG